MNWKPFDYKSVPRDGTRIAVRLKSGKEYEVTWSILYGGAWRITSSHWIPWHSEKNIVEWRVIEWTYAGLRKVSLNQPYALKNNFANYRTAHSRVVV